jgi:hypothetical protein
VESESEEVVWTVEAVAVESVVVESDALVTSDD